MSDDVFSTEEAFEKQGESLADAWNDEYKNNRQRDVARTILLKNYVRLANRAVAYGERDCDE